MAYLGSAGRPSVRRLGGGKPRQRQVAVQRILNAEACNVIKQAHQLALVRVLERGGCEWGLKDSASQIFRICIGARVHVGADVRDGVVDVVVDVGDVRR